MQNARSSSRALAVSAAVTLTTILVATVLTACSATANQPGLAPSDSRGAEPSNPSSTVPWVLFQQDAGARQEVAVMRLDGTERAAPLHDLGDRHQTNPDWSSDGRRIVFVMSDGARDDLWIADADGDGARKLLDCSGSCRWLDDPAWSPEGDRVVYSRAVERPDGSGFGTLETIDVDTGEVDVVLRPRKSEFTAGARYSPDGRRVVFEMVHTTSPSVDADVDSVTLSVVRLSPGRGVRKLTDPRLFAGTADWSPDGARIVYTALLEPGGEAQELFWISPTGGAPTRITHVSDAGGFAVEPAWLPDGSGVLFSGHVAAAPGSPELLRVDLDGSDLVPAFGDSTIYGRHPRVQQAP